MIVDDLSVKGIAAFQNTDDEVLNVINYVISLKYVTAKGKKKRI